MEIILNSNKMIQKYTYALPNELISQCVKCWNRTNYPKFP